MTDLYTDADFEMAEMAAAADGIAAAERSGTCAHTRTKPGPTTPQRECFDCGAVFADDDAHMDAYHAVLAEWT